MESNDHSGRDGKDSRTGVITRVWHGKTAKRDRRTYLDFLLGKGTRDYLKTPGVRSVKIWTNTDAEGCHFLTVTEWDDMQAVRRFAGADPGKAVYYPEDQGMLLEFEEGVAHYETHEVSHFRIQALKSNLEHLLSGSPWLGDSFLTKLEGLSETRAFHSPLQNMNCIAALVWHCAYWMRVAVAHLEGDATYKERTVERNNFFPEEELRRRGWAAIRRELLDAHTNFLAALEAKPDSLLGQEYHPGYTFEYLIEGIVQHQAYHLGQIGLLIRWMDEAGIRQ